MPKAKPNSKPISDREILSLYEEIIPLLSHNPEGLKITDQIHKWLRKFVHYDFHNYVMEEPNPFPGPLNLRFEWLPGIVEADNAPSFSIYQTRRGVDDVTFDERIERYHQQIIDIYRAKHPDHHEFHYYRIESKTDPRIVMAWFRAKKANNTFTREEKNIFNQLAPHLIAVARAVITQVSLSQSFQYFHAIAELGSKLAREYELSDSEVRLIPDILFGYSYEEMAERNFVSLATVKTHINHILKKTGTKSRLEFIGKFFTSPERVLLPQKAQPKG